MNGKKKRPRSKTNAASFRTLKDAAGVAFGFSSDDITYDRPLTEISDTELAALAWQINPELCKKDLAAAIKLTIRTLLQIREAKREAFKQLMVEVLTAQHRRGEERRVKFVANFRTSGREDYYGVIRFITHEKNWDRALKKIKLFERARGATDEKSLEKVLAAYKTKIFTGTELMGLWGEFEEFWRQQKSRQAQKAVRARKGRVRRPKSDLRFTENRRHKQGYCRNCGKRVSQVERLCDACASGKPLVEYFGVKYIQGVSEGPIEENIVGRY